MKTILLSTARRPWIRDFLIFFSFVALTVLMTYPWINYLRDACSDTGDPYLVSYILWWDYHQTFHNPLQLFHATIFYPYKYTLAFSEHHYGIALLLFPFFAAGLRPLTVHAIASLGAFAFSGYGMFRLARTLTGSNGAAWVAGVVFAFIPYRFHQLPHLVYMFAGWIPLTLEALVLFLRKPGWLRTFWLGAAFFMNALTCIHWGIMAPIPLALSAAFLLFRHRKWRDATYWRRGLLALGIASILLIPFLYPYVRVAKLYNFVRNPDDARRYSANTIHWLVADDRNKLWSNLNALPGANERALFPGLLPYLLAFAAFFLVEPAVRQGSSGGGSAPSRRVLVFLDVLIIVFAILILVTTGFPAPAAPPLILRLLQLSSPSIPFILFVVALLVRMSLAYPEIFRRIQGQNLLATLRANQRSDAFWLGMIWSLTGFCGSLGMNFFFHRMLYEYVPLFRSIRVPARWAMIAYIGLALLAGLGAQAFVVLLARHWKGVHKAAVYVVIAVAVLFEQRAAPLVLVRGAVFPNGVYLKLKETQMAGGIVELPAGPNSNFMYVLRAADHGHPLVTAFSGFFPPIEHQIEDLTRQKPIPDGLIDLLESIPTSYLVVHTARLGPESRVHLQNVLGRAVASGRLRFIRSYGERDDLYAIVKIEPDARSEANLPYAVESSRTGLVLEADAPDSSGPPNPIDDAEIFTRMQYLDFLEREPDHAGLAYWTGQISSCGSEPTCLETARVNVSAAFFVEREFQQTGFFVYRFYKGVLGRQPSYAEFKSDRQLIIGDDNLESSKQEFIATAIRRREFLRRFPLKLNTEEFVDALLKSVNESSSGEVGVKRGELIEILRSGSDRASVVRAILDNQAFYRAEYNRAFVLMQYFGYLKRQPDAAGYAFWVETLNKAPHDYQEMVRAFITSKEYRSRFLKR